MPRDRLADLGHAVEAELQEVRRDERAGELLVAGRPGGRDRAKPRLVVLARGLLRESLQVLAVPGLTAPGQRRDHPGEGYWEWSDVHWPIRMITNSAGRTVARPTRQTSRPLSRSSCVIVE